MSQQLDNVTFSKRWLTAIQAALSGWFEVNARSYPWRDTDNPYNVLVAEKLLQQTAARPHVVDVYERLLSQYPNLQALSSADPDDVLEIVRSLGLPRRAGELVHLAHLLVNRNNGQIPDSITELVLLPGVGQYIARAVCCFAFDKEIAVVDTNIARWIFRLFGIEDPLPNNPARKRPLLDLAQRMLNKNSPKQYNWSVLDLCAIVCTSRNPRCEDCPLVRLCAYGRTVN
jgi:A/G-specific adenine glycosylase